MSSRIAIAGFNTAIDTVATAEHVRAGDVIRLSSVDAYPGGKGVHVAQACAALAEAVSASVSLVGLADDAHEEWFARTLAARGVTFRGVRMSSRLRTCYAIRDAGGAITELLEPGPSIDADTIAQLEQAFVNEACAGASVAVLTGSLPASCPVDLYGTLVTRLRQRHRDRVPYVLVDASGPALEAALAAAPTLVKPNREEASRLLGRELATTADALDGVREIARRGVRIAIISLGADGAAVSWDGRVAHVPVSAQGEPSSAVAATPHPSPLPGSGASEPALAGDHAWAVGSGDCFVGGLAFALARGLPPDEALRLAAACGMANLRTREPGWFEAADVAPLMQAIRVDWR